MTNEINDKELEAALTDLAEGIMDAYCLWVEDDPETGYGHYEFSELKQPE